MSIDVSNCFADLLASRKEKISTVSRATGISRTTLTKLYYETSQAISFETLSKLCSYFQCEIGDILKRKVDNSAVDQPVSQNDSAFVERREVVRP